MMPKYPLPTVAVANADVRDGYMLVNRADYDADPSKWTLWDVEKKAPVAEPEKAPKGK